VDEVIASSPAQVLEYQSGKNGLFGYFVGQCMKQSKGKGNPKIFTELLKSKIG
jgi:aspartyl-tRNA(Asn)/glutamyl-tRNA(Gln) amidotransferase subunit B